MSKSKIIHARIDDETHDQLLEKCNEIGCTISEYFESMLIESLNDEPEPEEKKHVEEFPKYDLELNLGKITDKTGMLIGYLKGFPRPEIKLIQE